MSTKYPWDGAKVEDVTVLHDTLGGADQWYIVIAGVDGIIGCGTRRETVEFFADAIRADIRRRNGPDMEAVALELAGACDMFIRARSGVGWVAGNLNYAASLADSALAAARKAGVAK